MGDIRVPGSDDLRSLVDLIDSADRLRVLISGTANQPGLLSKADAINEQLAQFVASVDDVFVRLGSAASLASEVRETPKRLLTAAESKDFRDVLENSMSAAGVAAVESIRQRAGEMAVNLLMDDLSDRMSDALEQANVRVFGSNSFADQHAARKAAESTVKSLQAQLDAQVEQIKALKSAEAIRIGELAAAEKARLEAIAESEKERYGIATRYLADAQGNAVKAATRRVIPALIVGVLLGVWLNDQFLSQALYQIVFNETIPCAPVLR